MFRDRSKTTSHNLSAKVLKALDILPTECEVIFEPTLSILQVKFVHLVMISLFGSGSSESGVFPPIRNDGLYKKLSKTALNQ